MATLREMSDLGWSITLSCRSASARRCHNSWTPTWDQLIQYFGPEFDLTGDRSPMSKLVCERCGSRGASVIVQPPDDPNKKAGPGGHGHQSESMSVEEATRKHHEFMAEFRRLGFKTNEELARETRARIKAEKLAAKTGTDFIGPPNPWAHRKRGRWL